MFDNNNELLDRGNFLESTRAAREERALEKRRESATVLIQSLIRRWLARRTYVKRILDDFDGALSQSTTPINNQILYTCIRRLLFVFDKKRDRDRFIRICQMLVSSLEVESPKINFIGLALNQSDLLLWIKNIGTVLWQCCDYLDELQPELSTDMKSVVLYLHVLISFTSTNNWALLKQPTMDVLKSGMHQLCANLMGTLFHRGLFLTLKGLLLKGLGRTKVVLKHGSLSAIINLTLRPLVSADFSDKVLIMFIIHILSVPALIYHLNLISKESLNLIVEYKLFGRCLQLLSSQQQSMRIVFNTLEGSYALCLLGNLVQLAHIEQNIVQFEELAYPVYTDVLMGLLTSCQNYVVSKQSNLTHWHPVLGWFAQALDSANVTSMTHVKQQLQLLWRRQIVDVLMGDYLEEQCINQTVTTTHNQTTPMILMQRISPTTLVQHGNFFKKVLGDTGAIQNISRGSQHHRLIDGKLPANVNFNDIGCQRVLNVCRMYYTALNTLTQLRLDMLTGLCYQTGLLYDLWMFLSACGARAFDTTNLQQPQFDMLQLFCDCMTHYVTILDDVEMYEQQEPFKLNDFIVLSQFLNSFLYKAITSQCLTTSSTLFQSTHALLVLLKRRDGRRSFTPSRHWLIKDVKPSVFLNDLEKGRKIAHVLLHSMPHVIPHEDRVRLFRKYVLNEKTALGLTESASASPHSTLITVHRARIVEDGYRQLAALPVHALKGLIRVRFINEQGLDEAGIDQDGVFKEFLEECVKKVFDPSLNLFKCTAQEQRLYPASTSHLHDNHLQLFEFVGRLLGKAMYEGIVVDVPFAPFFLSQIAGHAQTLYSCVDELPSMDPELYRSLTYVKHYNSDVSQLDLTFSLDEDTMGRLVTHELVPGGKAITVTNDNKINYIHLMAHFRMYIQIKEQTQAFVRGFRTIINPEWLTLFSTPELQRLIAGDNVPLDMKDLRRHTQYYGGFHDAHRVVGWLWDVLEKDFSEIERGMFLKFVTSCSKPPLLGFAHLEPPFSIRCVEVGDDEDTGDTIGSVFRGFFTIRKKEPQNRLPTSSTCFNLLKLPNYQRKSILKEKLRYAVTCNTGFELS